MHVATFQSMLSPIHQSLLSHKLVYNGGFSDFELPLLVWNSTNVAQIFCGLKVCFKTFVTQIIKLYNFSNI